ncbi:MAG: Fic family protein [Clostridia bacterium]|nr:Fic family protein [Clostridia bacterium]MDD4387016.1 Fic family protein [Clostridia bacterium]
MKLENYVSGTYTLENDYKAFLPSNINVTWNWDDTKLNKLLSEASMQVGELNAYSMLIPNVDLYIKMHVRVEANKSSKIEGTKTTIEEDLSDIEDIMPEKRDDWEEVQNYIKAINFGIENIKEGFPLCNRLIRQAHEILLDGVRGKQKLPGEFRKSQNWIGGSMPSNAIYVPPSHIKLPECLSDFEKFINNENDETPDLIKIAMLHYQFESIHPFLDGNGRIGRLIIPLYMLNKGMLHKPCLYISDYFERNRESYYNMLTKVRTHNDIIGWVKFFLEGLIETAKIAKEKFKNVVALTQEMDKLILELNVKPENARKVLDLLYNEPKISRKRIIEITGMKPATATIVVNAFEEKGILIETTGYSRNKVFVFEKYINLFLK